MLADQHTTMMMHRLAVLGLLALLAHTQAVQPVRVDPVKPADSGGGKSSFPKLVIGKVPPSFDFCEANATMNYAR